MKTHPARLIVLFPMYEVVDYRRRLTRIDDALVVHRDVDDAFQLELRPMVKLTTRGPKSYVTALLRLAADLEAGYTVMIVDREPSSPISRHSRASMPQRASGRRSSARCR